MVQAIIDISNDANRVLNIVKAKYEFRNKSEAINFVTIEFGQELLDPELRPDFIEKIKIIEKEETITVGNIEDFKKRYGLD